MAETRKVVKYRIENKRANQVGHGDIIVDGLRVMAKFGHTNTGTNETRYHERLGERFATHAEALARAEQLVEKRSRHYPEKTKTEEDVPGGEATLAKAASNPELEAQLIAARGTPNEAGAATVYADWLQTNGDIRGELASLFLAGKTDEANAWIASHTTELFGDLDVKFDDEVYGLVWSHGFLAGASLKRSSIDSSTDLGALTKDLLALPVARLVTALRFGLAGFESDNDWGPAMAAIAEAPQAQQLRSLKFDDYDSEDCEISWVAFGDFSPHWESFPALEVLVIRSGEGGTLGDVALPNLKKLVRISGGLSSSEIAAILGAKTPKLEFLEIWTGSDNYGADATAETFTKFFNGGAPATLRHLGICNSMITHELIEPLAASKLLPQLRTLDLSQGVLQDGDVDLVIQHAAAFKHLEDLDLSENLLEERGGEITGVLPNANVDGQRDPEEDRYVALGE
jgi:hypothetical protein